MVSAYIGNTELSSASVWGIESDSGEDYFQEIENSLIAECEKEAIEAAKLIVERLGEWLSTRGA